MKVTILQYREIIPDEGKLLKHGDILTDYVNEPYTEEMIWEEVDAADYPLPEENIEEA